jgi:hypothetical protein
MSYSVLSRELLPNLRFSLVERFRAAPKTAGHVDMPHSPLLSFAHRRRRA